MQILSRRGTHSGRLERWLGVETVEHLSRSMALWPGPPIAVAGVPGNVWAMKGGDFRGPIGAGQLSNALDYAGARLRRIMLDAARRQDAMCHAGFSSLSDLIAEATAGKRRDYQYQKAGVTGVVAGTNSLWGVGPSPAAGANAAAAPGGEAPTDATIGAHLIDNVTADTRHFVSGWASVAGGVGSNLLLYDRLFQVNKTMASTATEAVTGVPTRYQSSTPANPDYAGGNFVMIEVGGTALAATAHNWTVCTYRNQAGTDAQTAPSMVGNSAAIVRRLDHPLFQWFMPLADGDIGAMDLAQMQCSASVATGVINFVIGHPIAMFPCPIANIICGVDGINTAFNLVRIFDDAALAWLELNKAVTTALSFNMCVTAVHG